MPAAALTLDVCSTQAITDQSAGTAQAQLAPES